MPTVTTDAKLTDQIARISVENDLDDTIFLEAGAGSGKTAGLARRVTNLVCVAGIPIESIAAVTFTEKAALELVDRIRSGLISEIDGAGTRSSNIERATQALRGLGSAQIGTIHSLCATILRQFAFEVGLPPNFRVMDGIEQEVAFTERWRDFLGQVLSEPVRGETDPRWSIPFLFGSSSGSLGNFPKIARALDDSWDRVQQLAELPCPPKPSLANMSLAPTANLLEILRETESNSAITDAGRARNLRLMQLCEVVLHEVSHGSEFDLIDALDSAPNAQTKKYQAQTPNSIAQLRVEEALAELHVVKADFMECALKACSVLLVEFTRDGVAKRRLEGTLGFQDLIAFTAELLKHPIRGGRVLPELQNRFKRILIDEFQDTDPLQVDILLALGANITHKGTPNPHSIDNGRLFFVGDPKQSIYRFRGADVHSFVRVSGTLAKQETKKLQLTSNFRSQEHIVEWVNNVYGEVMDETLHGFNFTELDSTVPDMDEAAKVTVLCPTDTTSSLNSAEIHKREARFIASEIMALLSEKTIVRDPKDGSLRTVVPSDITILAPTRTPLNAIELELDKRSLPVVSESSSITFKSPELYELSVVLEAISDAGNELMVLSALRSSILGCSDTEIYHFINGGKRSLNYHVDRWFLDPNQSGTLVESLRWLHEMSNESRRLRPFDLIDKVIRERDCFAMAEILYSPSQTRSRYNVYLEEARQWEYSARRPTLGAFLTWMRERVNDQKRVSEPPDPSGPDSIRLMTIHAAKGLEFPIVFLAGLGGGRSARSQVVGFTDDGSVLLSATRSIRSEGWEDWSESEKISDLAEYQRLIYVAMTRARDRLFVSLFEKAKKLTPGSTQSLASSLTELVIGNGALAKITEVKVEPPDHPTETRTTSISESAPRKSLIEPSVARDRLKSVSEAVRSQAEPRFVSPSDFEQLGETERADELAKSFGGDLQRTSVLNPDDHSVLIGIATHRALQSIDFKLAVSLEDPSALIFDASRTACAKPIFNPLVDEVSTLVSAAIRSDLIRYISALPHRKEVYFCTPLQDGRIMEGYVDLIYEAEGALHIVDYKTAKSDSPELIRIRSEQYQAQALAYAEGISASISMEVGSVSLLFLHSKGAIQTPVSMSERRRNGFIG